MNYKILLNKLLQKRFKKLLAVDIGSINIKLAVVDGAKRTPVVTALYQEDLPPELQGVTFGYNASALADFINGVVKREKIKANAVVFSIGADNSAVLTFDMPNMPDSELLEAARWELAHELNSEPDSFNYAAAYLTENNEGLNEVIAAVMPQSAAKAFTEIAAQLDLPLCGVFLRSAAVEQTFNKSYTDFILFDCTGNEALITAFNNALPVLQKQFNSEINAVNIMAAIAELQATLPETEFKQLVINGNINADLMEGLEASGLPVVINDITQSIGFVENLPAEYLQQLDSFAAVIGTALCYLNGRKLNLLPLKQNTFTVNRWQAYRAAAACCIACFLAAWAWQLVLLYSVQHDLQKVQQEIADMGKWQQRYEDAAAFNENINHRLKLTENLRKQNTDWQQILSDIAESTPTGCWLEKIEQGSENREVIISGYAPDMPKAVEFVEALGKHGKTELTELKTAQVEGKSYAAFNLMLERK